MLLLCCFWTFLLDGPKTHAAICLGLIVWFKTCDGGLWKLNLGPPLLLPDTANWPLRRAVTLIPPQNSKKPKIQCHIATGASARQNPRTANHSTRRTPPPPHPDEPTTPNVKLPNQIKTVPAEYMRYLKNFLTHKCKYKKHKLNL